MQRDLLDPIKSIPPATPFGFIERPRLLDPILSRAAARFVTVQAPPGYGKTSLIASLVAFWRQGSDAPHRPIAWYSLDASDDDPAVFVEGLVEAIHRVIPSAGKSVIAVLRDVPDASVELPRLIAVLGQEIRDACDEMPAVVLDDFHLISNKAILETLEQHLRDSILPFTLIATSEIEPPFYLSTLRAQEALVEIGEDDLRFTPDEVSALLRLRAGDGLEPKAVESVVREVRGWPSATAVAAAIVARTRRPLPFSRLAPTEHGFGQLLKEVLGGAPPALRNGLARSSLLHVVDPDVLRTTLGVAEAAAVVEMVEKLALPAARVGLRGQQVRYDPVLKAALERDLAATTPPQDLRTVQKEVASYYAGIGLWDRAVQAYLRGWAPEDAATLVEEAAPEEISRRHLDTVLRWLREIPNVTRKGRPRLMVQEARALLARGDTHAARVLLTTAEASLKADQDWHGVGQRAASWCALQLAEGNYPEAARWGQEALSHLAEEQYVERADVYWMLARAREMLGELAPAFDVASDGLLMAENSGRQELVVRALSQLANLAELRGDYTVAVALSGRTVDRAALFGAEDVAIVSTGGVAASVYLERDQAAEAAVVANEMLRAVERLRDPLGELRARLALARVEEMKDGASLDNVGRTLLASSETQRGARMERVLIFQAVAASLIRQGKRGEGTALARRSRQLAEDLAHRPSTLRSELLVLAGEAMGPTALKPLLDGRARRDDLSATDCRHWLSAADRIVAQGYTRLGVGWRARKNLRESLSLAAREGYVGMPLRLPSRAESLLVFAVRNGVEPEVAGSLLGVAPQRGRKALAPLLADKNPSVRARAQLAVAGLESGAGRFPKPRVPWPSLYENLKPAQVVLQTLGGMNAFVDEQPETWPSEDALNLAAYLVVRRAVPVPRGTALHDVWPAEPEPEAHVRLQVALQQIRATLGSDYPRVDPVREGKGEYYWDGAGCFIDVEHFRVLMRALDAELPTETPPILTEATVKLLEEAVGIYQGEFLSNLYFDWCVSQREELRARLLRVTRLLIDHYMALNQWRDAIRHGLKSLKSDPLQEDVVRDLMLCYFRIGDRASVTFQYREVKRLLARERGAWPADETRQLRIRLLGR